MYRDMNFPLAYTLCHLKMNAHTHKEIISINMWYKTEHFLII